MRSRLTTFNESITISVPIVKQEAKGGQRIISSRLPNSTTTVSKVITSATSMHSPAITVREIAAKEIMESGTRTTLKRNTRADIPKDVRPKTTSSRMLQLTPDLILLLLHLDL
uniref:Uncharacterized protein n=1 Tax=Cacopsylla melanoneura TaxID=428564 RepID=A0A8D9B5M8_9HEMI